MTDPLGQSQVIPYLIGLSQKGHHINIISCEKADKFKSNEQLIKELLQSNNIQWFPVPYSSLPSIISKQLNLFLIERKAKQICKNSKIDLAHCRSYMASLIGLKLKKKFGIKFLFDMRGLWADERIDGKIWDLNNPIHKQIFNYFKKKESEFLLNADHTVSLTQNAKNEILSWEQFQNKKIAIEVIPCCADLDLFSINSIDQKKQTELQNTLKINKGDLVISYLGSVGTWYMLDEMLHFFKILSSEKPNAKFLFITQDDKKMIQEKAAAKGIALNKIMIHSAKRNEVPLYLSLSHIALYFITPLYSKKASSPTKTGEIMAMGIPIITNSGIGDSDKILKDANAGLLINDFTVSEYSRIIKQIDVLLTLDKKKIIAEAEKNFSLNKGIELYGSIYNKLI